MNVLGLMVGPQECADLVRFQHPVHFITSVRSLYRRAAGGTLVVIRIGVVFRLDLELREIPRPALFLAAKAYAHHHKRGGSKLQVLPDVFIGAHAVVEDWPLLTRDASRFRTCFPTLEVVAP